MLKYKLKQWLAVNEPGALPVKTEPGSPPTCVTPPLPRSPSTSDVNKYPSLKKKILGPKMVDADHPHAESPTTSSKENAGNSTLGNKYTSTFASTTDLAAAAAFATGLQPSKRKRDRRAIPPTSPPNVKKERSDDGSDRAKSPKPNKPKPKPKPRTPKASEKTSQKSDDGEPKEETDEEIARRLHAEFNCAPMRTSRSRRTMDLENPRDGGTPEDPVHDNDPGILPSC